MWKQIFLTVVVGVSLAVVGIGAQALSGQISAAQATDQRDDAVRAAELIGLSEAEIRDLRERGVAWALIRQAADIVAAEGISVDEALERIREDIVSRSEAAGSDHYDRAGDRSRNDRDGNSRSGADQAARIAESTGFSVVEIREFQVATGFSWPDIRQIAIVAWREQISLESAIGLVELRN